MKASVLEQEICFGDSLEAFAGCQKDYGAACVSLSIKAKEKKAGLRDALFGAFCDMVSSATTEDEWITTASCYCDLKRSGFARTLDPFIEGVLSSQALAEFREQYRGYVQNHARNVQRQGRFC